jgi:hypothetical protein
MSPCDVAISWGVSVCAPRGKGRSDVLRADELLVKAEDKREFSLVVGGGDPVLFDEVGGARVAAGSVPSGWSRRVRKPRRGRKHGSSFRLWRISGALRQCTSLVRTCFGRGCSR